MATEELIRDGTDPDAEPSQLSDGDAGMSGFVQGVFIRERACKNSVRYQPIDDAAKNITAIIYLMNESVEMLEWPDKIVVTITAPKS